MKMTRSRAKIALFSCVIALASAACNNDEKTPGDGSIADAGMDARIDAATDASTDASTDAATDASTDASTDAATDASMDASMDASVPQVAFIRLAHLAIGYGSTAAGNIHVCVKQTRDIGGFSRTLFTARKIPATSTTWTALPLPYNAISTGLDAAPLFALNSGIIPGTSLHQNSVAEIWAADDLDTSASTLGMQPGALCVPKASTTPIATLAVPENTFAAGKRYTVILTGRNDATLPGCYAGTGALGTCPGAKIEVLEDAITPSTTGTSVRIVNTSTTYAVQGSCSGLIDLAGLSTKSSSSLSPVLTTATPTEPRPFFRVGTPSLPFNSDFVDTMGNLTAGSVTIPAGPTVAVPRLFSPILPASSTTFMCPTKAYVLGGGGAPASQTETYANGSFPQVAAFNNAFVGPTSATNPAAQAVGLAGTHTGDAITLFILDTPNPAFDLGNPASPTNPTVVPVQLGIVYACKSGTTDVCSCPGTGVDGGADSVGSRTCDSSGLYYGACVCP